MEDHRCPDSRSLLPAAVENPSRQIMLNHGSCTAIYSVASVIKNLYCGYTTAGHDCLNSPRWSCCQRCRAEYKATTEMRLKHGSCTADYSQIVWFELYITVIPRRLMVLLNWVIELVRSALPARQAVKNKDLSTMQFILNHWSWTVICSPMSVLCNVYRSYTMEGHGCSSWCR
jgi:hypothetical protein